MKIVKQLIICNVTLFLITTQISNTNYPKIAPHNRNVRNAPEFIFIQKISYHLKITCPVHSKSRHNRQIVRRPQAVWLALANPNRFRLHRHQNLHGIPVATFRHRKFSPFSTGPYEDSPGFSYEYSGQLNRALCFTYTYTLRVGWCFYCL